MSDATNEAERRSALEHEHKQREGARRLAQRRGHSANAYESMLPPLGPSVSAGAHRDLTITGLSAPDGGWLGRRAFYKRDPVFAGSSPERRLRVRAELEARFAAGLIDLHALPEPVLTPDRSGRGSLAADRIRGILFGAAIGDALGNTSESMPPSAREKMLGEVRDYLPNVHAGMRRVGLPSDDTQMLVATLESMLEHGGPNLDALGARFATMHLFGIGSTMRTWQREVRGGSAPWAARQRSAGNGALMRVAGAVLPYAWTFDQGRGQYHEPGADQLDDGVLEAVALTSALTHDDRSSTAACVAFAEILRHALRGDGALTPQQLIDGYVASARRLEGDEVALRSRVRGETFCGPLWRFVAERVPQALESGKSVREVCNGWQSAAYLLETVPSALFILAKHGDDPEEALVRAVNDTWDNDTVATVVGMVLGAMHGYAAFPQRWRHALLGRTGADDDGKLEQVYNQLRRYGGYGQND